MTPNRGALTVALPDPHGASPVPLQFQFIPAGSFRMGQRGGDADEEPVHRVTIIDHFYLGTYPVTQAQYRVMASSCISELERIEGNRGVATSNFTGDQHPAEQVSWDDARCICQWLTRSGLLPQRWRADLPSETQWEYACRAGTQTDWWSGDREEDLAKVAWYGGNAGGETHPVGQKERPNAFGLHDMHGNVWEWCLDYYDPRRYRKRRENSADEPLLEPRRLEFEEPNPTLVLIAEMLRRFAGGDFAVRPGEEGALTAYRSFAELRVENGDNQWKKDIEAANFATRAGRWPDEARSLAQESQPVFQDWVDATSDAANPARVLRGGAFGVSAAGCRAACRFRFAPGLRFWNGGFRLALVPVR